MRSVIGNNLIATLKAKEKQYDVRDAKLKGFLIRVTPTGKMSYVCQYGRGKRVNIGPVGVMTPMQARDEAKRILSQVVMGILPSSTNENRPVTFRIFIDNEYSSWRKANRKSAINDLKRLAVNFYEDFGECLLKEITPVRLDRWRTKRINEGIKSATVNRDIVILRAALSKAVEWGIIVENPLQGFKPFKIDSIAMVRYLTKQEEKRLKAVIQLRDTELKAARSRHNKWKEERGYDCLLDIQKHSFADHIAPMISISLNTGLRRGELFNLQWQDIDFERSILKVIGETAKSGKTRYIPLNTTVLEVLEKWRHQNKRQGYIFLNELTGKKFGHVKSAWKGILNIAKIENFRWHDMRHHFASKLIMAGVDLNTVRELLGHSDIKMTLRYAHLAPEHKQIAVSKLVEIE